MKKNIEGSKKRILIASPIRQKAHIFCEFLDSLKHLNKDKLHVDYFFIDDNEDVESSRVLDAFYKQNQNHCTIVAASQKAQEEKYICSEKTHEWNEALIWKVADFKDQMLERAKELEYDYIFLVDSDLVLHPKTLEQLIASRKDIISNIFWTSWVPNAILLPQVWMSDHYTQYEYTPGEDLSDEERRMRHMYFLTKMRTPGVYEVGGLGACTLISKKALDAGVNFKKIKNISLCGEDRHFCLRAVALGLDLYVDTHFPAYHIYRESALADVEHFKRISRQVDQHTKTSKPRITLSLIMKNEGSRYLRRVLEDAKKYITDAVIIDDGSTDNSVAICKEVLADIPHVLVKNTESMFCNEIHLRKLQWNETIKTNPEWIVFLDADEIFDDQFKKQVHELVKNPSVDVYYFRLYDFWNESEYREDEYWKAHTRYQPFLARYRSDIPYVWNSETPQHCGRYPSTILYLIGMLADPGLKHYGWATAQDRISKYKRYQELDPDAKYGIKQQYESILDENPVLIRWCD